MVPIILSVSLIAFTGEDTGARKDARLLIDTIESLQHSVQDFRCEYEGTTRFMGKVAQDMKVGGDGLYESFSGVFIWERGGDTRSDSLHRRAADGQIARESLAVRMHEHQAEEYRRLDNAPLGFAVIKNPKEVMISKDGNLGLIFLVDQLKRDVADEFLDPSVLDDRIGGRPLKVLNFALKGVPGSVLRRYWVDLGRNGHVVRSENYAPPKVVMGRVQIELAPFKVGDAEVWMPVSGESVGFAALVDKKPVVTNEPTSTCRIYVVGGTMEFNKRPGRGVFTINYKPGTPISDNLRKLTYEFGQQQVGQKPTKADAEKMLSEQLSKAEEQKANLVVASPSEGVDWASLMFWGFSALVVISSVVLMIQRRRN
jgi:hypothetical protein